MKKNSRAISGEYDSIFVKFLSLFVWPCVYRYIERCLEGCPKTSSIQQILPVTDIFPGAKDSKKRQTKSISSQLNFILKKSKKDPQKNKKQIKAVHVRYFR